MSARSGYFGVWTLCSLAVLSATAAMAGPGVRHCTPITAQVTPDTTNGRHVSGGGTSIRSKSENGDHEQQQCPENLYQITHPERFTALFENVSKVHIFRFSFCFLTQIRTAKLYRPVNVNRQ